MPEKVYLGFDFGFKRIGTAVGQSLTRTASPLTTIKAQFGIPDWTAIAALIKQWKPSALIVGLPTCIDDKELYTTAAARKFAEGLSQHFSLPVHLSDERLSTVEARERLFASGGYRKIRNSQIDCIAAVIILEQWLAQANEDS